MRNVIKYDSANLQPDSIKSGNFNISTKLIPTIPSGFYNGITPIIGGYTIYMNKTSGGPSIYSPKNDSELVAIVQKLGGSVSTAADALVWINSQSNMTVLNNNYPSIVTSGLVMNLDAGFVSSYPKTGTTWKDLSGNGYNGTLVNGPTYSTDGGGSISFDGTDDYVSLPINSSFNTSSITFEVWANLSSTPSRQILMVNWEGNSLEVNANRSVVMYNYSSGGQLGAATSASIFNWGSWTHFLGVYDNSSQSLKTYINGVLQATSTGVQSTIYSVGVHKIAGTDYSLGIFGNVASARHYNRALSAAEVLQNYYAGLQRLIPTNGLVLSLDAQNTNLYATSSTTAYDISGNGNNGTLTNGVQYISDGDGSWSFDGIDDYIKTPTIINFRTFNFWVKIKYKTDWRYLVDARPGMTSGGYYTPNGSSGWTSQYINGSLTSVDFNLLPLNEWCNLTLIADANYTSTINFMSRYTNNEMNGGGLNEIRIYNRVLTQAEITTIYNATKSRYGIQ